MVNGYIPSASPPEQEPEVEASKSIVENSDAIGKLVDPSIHKFRTYITANRRRLPFIIFVVVIAIIGGRLLWPTHAEEAKPGTNIDYTSQSAVDSAYWKFWAPAQTTDPGWTGSVNNCHPGTMSSTARNSEVDALNFARRLEQLVPIRVANSITNANDMKEALILQANGDSGDPHFPPKSSKCWTQAGYKAAGESDLDFIRATDSEAAGIHLAAFLDDGGVPNLGHRLTLLDPVTSAFGIATSANSTVVQVFNVPVNNSNPQPDTMWPMKGYFPSTLAPSSDWSYTVHNYDISFSKATLSVTHNGVAVAATKHNLGGYYVGPTLAWTMPSNYEASGDYTVTIKKIYNTHTHKYTSRSYTIHFYPVQPTLKLVARVDNHHGGTKTPHDWTLTASGTDGFSDLGDSTTFHKVDIGVTYTLSESSVPGYGNIEYLCTNGNDFSAYGNTIKLSAGQNITCTITNYDQ